MSHTQLGKGGLLGQRGSGGGKSSGRGGELWWAVQLPSRSWGDLSHKEFGLILSPPDIPEQRPLIRPDLLVTTIPSLNMDQRYSTSQQGKGHQSLCIPTKDSSPWPTSIYSSFGFKTFRFRHNWLLPTKLGFFHFQICALGSKLLIVTFVCKIEWTN